MMGADFFESDAGLKTDRENGIPNIGIGRDCEVWNAFIDKNARIGDGVKLVNAKNTTSESVDNYAIVNGIIVVPKNAVIPDGTVI